MAWQEGKRLNSGRYIIKKQLGDGGFGVTYLATDTRRNNQDVAIKTLKDEFRYSPDFVKLQNDFEKEAQRLKKCVHPHIVKIYELFSEESFWSTISLGLIQISPKLCIVMEYLPGDNLYTLIKRQGALPEAEAIKYIQQVGKALKVVHENGLLHRDVKPENIMLRDNQSAVLIDFGIAREFIPNKTKKQTGLLTPFYAPPEQYIEISKRGAYTDIHALAATLYVLLVGKYPPYDLTRSVKIEPPQSFNPKISDRVNQAILKGMERRPEDRPQSVQDWLEMLPRDQEVVTATGKSRNLNPWICLTLYSIFWLAISWLDTASSIEVGAGAVKESYLFLVFCASMFNTPAEPYDNIKDCFVGTLIFSIITLIYYGATNETKTTFYLSNFDSSWLSMSLFYFFLSTIFVGVPSLISSSAKTGLRIRFGEFATFSILMVFSLLGIASSWLIHIWI